MSLGKRKFIPKSTLEKILGLVFVIMLFVVGFLTYKAFEKRKMEKVPDCDQEIPFLFEEANSVVEIDVSNIQENEKIVYTFKVMNYDDKNIIKSSLDYNIYFIANDVDVDLELYKDNKDVNLLAGNDDLLIRKKVLRANKKQEDFYKLVITTKEKIGEDKKVIMQVYSE